jgi:hypothetical protein
MSVSSIASPLVTLDVISDYIPVVSTLTNLVVLFQKCLVVPFMKADFIDTSHYFTHLKSKTFVRCIVLIIPVLGNAIVLLYDLALLKVHRDIKGNKKKAAPLEVSQPI